MNSTADSLSRLPSIPESENEYDDDSEVVCSINEILSDECITLENVKDKAELDTSYQQVIEFCKQGWPWKKELSGFARDYFNVRNELSVINGVLMKGDRLVIPSGLRDQVLRFAHKAHQGIARTKQQLRLIYWWNQEAC